MTAFVVLHHRLPDGVGRGDHFDFMVELEGRLVTWALRELPQPDIVVAAEQLPDHRLDYLAYQGPVSGGRGEVEQVDRGECRVLQFDEQRAQFELAGRTLQGKLTLQRNAQSWSAEFVPLPDSSA